ncbi:MAG: hypothetical protein Q4D62_14985 [Planctomycetia bacterium]|nr:hypothetical protein [Planctomycetia bacterium]
MKKYIGLVLLMFVAMGCEVVGASQEEQKKMEREVMLNAITEASSNQALVLMGTIAMEIPELKWREAGRLVVDALKDVAEREEKLWRKAMEGYSGAEEEAYPCDSKLFKETKEEYFMYITVASRGIMVRHIENHLLGKYPLDKWGVIVGDCPWDEVDDDCREALTDMVVINLAGAYARLGKAAKMAQGRASSAEVMITCQMLAKVCNAYFQEVYFRRDVERRENVEDIRVFPKMEASVIHAVRTVNEVAIQLVGFRRR